MPRRRSSAAPTPASPPEQWIKTGVELYEGSPQLSTVATDRWADWSIGPLDPAPGSSDGVTVEIVREGNENGKSAWVYRRLPATGGGDDGTKRVPLREICWIFADERDGAPGGPDEWILEVSPLVARPEKSACAPL